MGRWSRMLAPLLVAFAEVGDNEAVLDVGSGTGALSAAIGAAAPKSRITGIDPSPAYVAFAQARHREDRFRFAVGDAQRLAFSNGSFDRVLSLLVINFIPDPEMALGEMIRVTRPGGTVSAAVWDYGEGMQALRIFWDEAIALQPSNAGRDERHMPLCRPGELAQLWRKHGLRDVVEQPLAIDMRFGSFEEYWEPFLEKQGPAGAYVAGLDRDQRDALRRRLRRRLLADRQDGPLVLTARAWAVRGTAPPRERREE